MARIRINPLDELLIAAKRAGEKKVGLAGPVCVTRQILEFAQSFKVLKYREKRELLSTLAAQKKAENLFIKQASPKLSFKPDNWCFFFITNEKGELELKIIPEKLEGTELVEKSQEIDAIIDTNKETKDLYEEVKNLTIKTINLFARINKWIHDQQKNGSLETKIESFLKEVSSRTATRISKGLVSAFMKPEESQIIKKEGEIPELKVGEREAFQFLLWKHQNLTDRERHLKDNWILEGRQEDPDREGYIVVFEPAEALKKSYGENESFSGPQYQLLKNNLQSLLEKQRKILIKKKTETIELSLSLLNKLDMKHKLTDNEEFRNYIVVWIPKELVTYHEKLYTSYPDNHFALLRRTPPDSIPDQTEIRFFDFLYNEAPHRNTPKEFNRIKRTFVAEIAGSKAVQNNHLAKIAARIEGIYGPKAINMGLLVDFTIDTNGRGEEIYCFRFGAKKSRKKLFDN